MTTRITKEKIDDGLREYQYYLAGRNGSFKTSLFDAISHADAMNLVKLAKVYPEYVYAHLDYTGMLYKVDFEIIK